MDDPSDQYLFDESQCRYIRELCTTDPSRAAELIYAAVPAGAYLHYKKASAGPKTYIVLGPVQDRETKAWSVVYAPVFQPDAGRWISRSLLGTKSGFLVPVNQAGYRGSRFSLLFRLTQKELFEWAYTRQGFLKRS